MYKLNLPEYQFKIIKTNDKLKIFDLVRKKYVMLTPEEWVRQNFIMYIIKEKKVPESHIKIESSLQINSLIKRTDAVVYNKNMELSALIEFKAPDVKIDMKVFEQINIYNSGLKTQFLIVTNGITHYFAQINYEKEKIFFVNDFPLYEAL